MKQLRTIPGLITVISLFFGVIWLSPTLAAAAPSFTSLGQIKAEGLRVPGAMDLDDAGNLYVADARGGMVHQFDQYGSLLQSFDLQGTGRGLAVTPDGATLYVARELAVAIVDVASGQEREFVVVGAGSGEDALVGEIDLDAAGNVYVVDDAAKQVKVYDAAGTYRTAIGGLGKTAGLFWRIGGMMVNGVGQLVVADTSAENGMVHVFTLDSSLSQVSLATYLNATAAYFGAPVMYNPRGLTSDEQGRNYFLDFTSSQIRVTSAAFGFAGAYNNKGYAAGQLNNIYDAVYDAANKRLFVGCDTARIEILGVDGGQNPVNVNHPPSVPAPQEPIGGSEVASATPTLVFSAADDQDGDALTYNVVVSDQSGVVFSANVATTSVVVTTALDENSAYSWTVQASDGAAVSELSAAADFVVNAVEEAPLTPVLTAPLTGEVVAGPDALLWEATTDPDPNDTVAGYQVELALDAAFTQGVIVEDAGVATALSLGDMVAYGDLVDGATYFWRVVAVDNENVASAPSDPGQFVYDTTGLTVTSNMPDAVVSVSGNHAYAGQAIGVAPLELRDFAPGTYSVVVERAGFEPFVAQVALGDKDNADLYAELVPAMEIKNLSVSRRGINGRAGLAVSGDAAPFLVDFDNDGDLDLLVAAENSQISLFANMQMAGSNRLEFDRGQTLAPTGIVPFVADWNNDGRKDLVVGQADGTVKLFLNNGLEAAPAFAAGVDLLPTSVGLDAAPAVVDYNGDGNKDLLVGNAAGQVLLFVNQGDDAAPVFNRDDLGQPVLTLNGNVVPFPVDWDADGSKELLVANRGDVTVYAQVDGQYQVIDSFSERRGNFFAAFPIALDGTGKQLLAGQLDGELVYVTGNSTQPVAAFAAALQDKVAELGNLVGAVDPTLLDEVAAISVLVDAGDYAAAADAAGALAGQLGDGAAQTSALELVGLLQ